MCFSWSSTVGWWGHCNMARRHDLIWKFGCRAQVPPIIRSCIAQVKQSYCRHWAFLGVSWHVTFCVKSLLALQILAMKPHETCYIHCQMWAFLLYSTSVYPSIHRTVALKAWHRSNLSHRAVGRVWSLRSGGESLSTYNFLVSTFGGAKLRSRPPSWKTHCWCHPCPTVSHELKIWWCDVQVQRRCFSC